MIASLRGTVRQKDLQQAVIECQGVGYGVAMSLSSLQSLPPEGQLAFVFVHTNFSQDALRLYGFVNSGERDTFLVLLSTPGVGPRLALTILSTLSPAELAAAVRDGDKAQLCAITGVGKKKAERLLIELCDRLPQVLPTALPLPSLRHDLISALTNLGFAGPEAERLAQQAMAANAGEKELTALVRSALRTSR